MAYRFRLHMATSIDKKAIVTVTVTVTVTVSGTGACTVTVTVKPPPMTAKRGHGPFYPRRQLVALHKAKRAIQMHDVFVRRTFC